MRAIERAAAVPLTSMSKKLCVAALAATVSAGGWSQSASASVSSVPGATFGYAFQEGASSGGFSSSSPFTFKSGSCWQITQSPAPDPTVTANVVNPFSNATCSASSQIVYSFEVVGPNNLGLVPISISGNISIGGGGNFGSSGQIELTQSNNAGIRNDFFTCTAASPNPCGSHSVSYTVSLAPNTIFKLLIDASASASDILLADSSSASVDPRIEIAPNFADADQFSLILSNGIGNSPATLVPEPASLIIFGSGLAGFSVLRRWTTA